jgi:hypothetical protein
VGLFKSKTRVTVATQVSRVIKDDLLPDSVKTGVTKAILNEGDIPDYMLEELVGSVGLRADRMYDYAATKYTHGLPTQRITTAAAGQDIVQGILDGIEGTPVAMEYCQFGPPNSLHIAWMKLVGQYGYNPQTNILAPQTAAKGRNVYLEDIAISVPSAQLNQFEPGSLDQWGKTPRAGYTPWRAMLGPLAEQLGMSPVHLDDAATEDYARIFYVYGSGAVATETWRDPFMESFTFPIDGYDNAADFFHVRYTVGGLTKFWMYQIGTGTYPALDTLHGNGEFTMGSFFPFAYFRFNKTSENANKTTEAYKTSKKLVKYLGMDYDMVADGINENPDIADVEQAMLIMAVPANTSNPMEQRYLYDFFNGLHAGIGTNFNSFAAAQAAALLGSGGISSGSVVIQDRRFKMALSNSGIYKRRVAGSIGKVGSHASTTGVRSVSVTATVEWSDDGGSGSTTSTYDKPVKTHIYRRQVNFGQYDEIEVLDLKMLYHVYQHYTVTADETDDILLIPLDRSITNNYSIPDREELYSRSLHFVFNSVSITKIKWYQTGLFQIIMLVVAVVITIYSMGTDGGSLIGMALAGNAAAAYTLALVLLEKLVIGLVIQTALKLFVKAVGVEFAFAVALVAALYGGMQALQAGSVQGAPWAQELLQLSSGLGKGIQAEMQGMFADLYSEVSEFSLFVDERNKELEEARKLLEGNNRLSPFVIFGEKPEDFYNRTVHAGNVGAMGISAISSYVDIALTLPKINDTLGESFYVDPTQQA